MSRFPENRRPAFERVVINRITETGFSEVEIRTECLTKSSDGTYFDGSIQAYWEFWNAALDSLPKHEVIPVPLQNELSVLRVQRNKLASLLSSILENIDEVEHDAYILGDSEDFDVSEVLDDSRRTIELLDWRGDA